MAHYLMIESRDPFASGDVPYLYRLAEGLAARGDRVTLFLVQNGTLAARRRAPGVPIADLASSGVRILADDFSLRERAIHEDERHPSVTPAEIDDLVAHMFGEPGTKVVWH